MTVSRSADRLRTLARRISVLDALDESTADKRELVDRLGCSRSTVDRSLGELESLGFVEERKRSYDLTPTGQVARELYLSTVAALDSLLTAGPFLHAIPDRFVPPPELFYDAEVVTQASGRHEPTEFLVEAAECATKLWGVRGPVRPEFPASVRNAFVNGDVTADVILCRESIDWLERFHQRDLQAVLDSGNVVYRVIEESFPCGLMLVEADEEISVNFTVQNSSGEIVGVVRSTTPGAVAWGDEVFETFRERASRYP